MSGPTTFDEHQKHLTVEYKEPAAVNIATTHDLLSVRLTVEATRNEPGDKQIMGDQVYEYDGGKWVAV